MPTYLREGDAHSLFRALIRTSKPLARGSRVTGWALTRAISPIASPHVRALHYRVRFVLVVRLARPTESIQRG